uniref:Uncharacterized protein n=1 Tax=Sciurus vulgaris TaxID=55149 RepID=A0A8D2B3I6_SCIVU
MEGKPKNYAKPDVLCHTFEALSNLHKLLPNHLVELLQSYQCEEDKEKCETSEFSGLERILAGHELPKEINLTPEPSRMHSWQRKAMNNVNIGWKKCHLWKRNTKEPPMCTVVVSLQWEKNITRRWSRSVVCPQLSHSRLVNRDPGGGTHPVCGRVLWLHVSGDTSPPVSMTRD